MKIKMKKLAVLTLVVTLLAISVVPALAAGGPPANRGTGSGNFTGAQAGPAIRNQISFGVRTPFALSGTITTLGTGTVTVEVSCGNRAVKDYIGTTVTLQTDEFTRFLERNDDGIATPITFAELEVGQTVSGHGSLVDGVFSATRLTIDALLYCLP
jgi:hypothetical protein